MLKMNLLNVKVNVSGNNTKIAQMGFIVLK